MTPRAQNSAAAQTTAVARSALLDRGPPGPSFTCAATASAHDQSSSETLKMSSGSSPSCGQRTRASTASCASRPVPTVTMTAARSKLPSPTACASWSGTSSTPASTTDPEHHNLATAGSRAGHGRPGRGSLTVTNCGCNVRATAATESRWWLVAVVLPADLVRGPPLRIEPDGAVELSPSQRPAIALGNPVRSDVPEHRHPVHPERRDQFFHRDALAVDRQQLSHPVRSEATLNRQSRNQRVGRMDRQLTGALPQDRPQRRQVKHRVIMRYASSPRVTQRSTWRGWAALAFSSTRKCCAWNIRPTNA